VNAYYTESRAGENAHHVPALLTSDLLERYLLPAYRKRPYPFFREATVLSSATFNRRSMAAFVGVVTCVLTAGLSALLTAGLSAQNARSGAAAADSSDYVVIGCVRSPSRGVYTITDTRPTPPVTYRLDGTVDQLDWHVGHTIEVEGPISPASSQAGGASMPTLKVKALRYISTSCSK
jgi:hypothetical protein